MKIVMNMMINTLTVMVREMKKVKIIIVDILFISVII